jgi:hypothetical protein
LLFVKRAIRFVANYTCLYHFEPVLFYHCFSLKIKTPRRLWRHCCLGSNPSSP